MQNYKPKSVKRETFARFIQGLERIAQLGNAAGVARCIQIGWQVASAPLARSIQEIPTPGNGFMEVFLNEFLFIYIYVL